MYTLIFNDRCVVPYFYFNLISPKSLSLSIKIFWVYHIKKKRRTIPTGKFLELKREYKDSVLSIMKNVTQIIIWKTRFCFRTESWGMSVLINRWIIKVKLLWVYKVWIWFTILKRWGRKSRDNDFDL